MPTSFALETYARRALNYLDRMVDADGLPYFNVFWETPAEAAHDWPDFGDVMTRALQAAAMARRMTGLRCANEARWLRMALGLIDDGTGLLTRPATGYCRPGPDLGDYGLTLYALTTLYQDAPDPTLADRIAGMVDGFPHVRTENAGMMGFAIKSLMTAARTLGLSSAMNHARECVRLVLASGAILQEDNTYPTGGHMHIFTRTLVGLADYALCERDPVLYSRVDAAYRYLRSLDPGFGFLPEVVDRQGDVIACETCALMDYVGLGVTLAEHGHPEYWAGIERVVRNHLVESQAVDTNWLVSEAGGVDTAQFTRRDIGERMLGAYAGWSSPVQFLACREMLHWGGPELRGKVRAFQNCCGGSGTHAYYIAWKHAATFRDGLLSVNMHIDKLLPEAEVRCMQPWDGLLRIDLRSDCDVRVRTPDFALGATEVAIDGEAVATRPTGAFIRLPGRKAGERIELRYPVPVRTERICVGNRRVGGAGTPVYPEMKEAGAKEASTFNEYAYDVTWKGDTVVRIAPVGQMPTRGYSDFEQTEINLFYGEEGPCRLYRREGMLAAAVPEPTRLMEDTSPIDHWSLA